MSTRHRPASPSRPPLVVRPLAGQPAAITLDGRTRWLWWGQDQQDHDCVAARGGTAHTFSSERAVLATAEQDGWALAIDRDVPPSHTDLGPAQQWLAGQRLRLPSRGGLDLWNWAGDLARSTGQPWADRSRLADACCTQLFAATVPAAFDLEEHRPAWTARHPRTVHTVLGRAVHVIRTATAR